MIHELLIAGCVWLAVIGGLWCGLSCLGSPDEDDAGPNPMLIVV